MNENPDSQNVNTSKEINGDPPGMLKKGKGPQEGKGNTQLVGIILTGVFTVIAALISRIPMIELQQQKSKEEFKPTATVQVEANFATLPTATPIVALSPTYTLTPASTLTLTPTVSMTPTATVDLVQPTSTPTQIQATAMVLAGWDLYDDFNNDCVDTSQWGIFIDGRVNPLVFEEPAKDPCWSFIPQELRERDGQLEFNVANQRSNRDYVIYLVTRPGRAIEAIQMELAIETFQGEMGAVGLFNGPPDDPKQWLNFYLHTGEGLPEGVLDTAFAENNKVKDKGSDRYSPGQTVTLTMQWDGQDLNFVANGYRVMPPFAFDGTEEPFGIYFKLGPNSSMTARISEYRVIWK